LTRRWARARRCALSANMRTAAFALTATPPARCALARAPTARRAPCPPSRRSCMASSASHRVLMGCILVSMVGARCATQIVLRVTRGQPQTAPHVLLPHRSSLELRAWLAAVLARMLTVITFARVATRAAPHAAPQGRLHARAARRTRPTSTMGRASRSVPQRTMQAAGRVVPRAIRAARRVVAPRRPTVSLAPSQRHISWAGLAFARTATRHRRPLARRSTNARPTHTTALTPTNARIRRAHSLVSVRKGIPVMASRAPISTSAPAAPACAMQRLRAPTRLAATRAHARRRATGAMGFTALMWMNAPSLQRFRRRLLTRAIPTQTA